MKNIIIKMPNSLNDIKVGHLQHLYNLETIHKDPYELRLQKIAYLANTSIEKLREVSQYQINEIDLSFLEIKFQTTSNYIETFKLNGVRYMRDDLGNESVGMHMDFMELAKQPIVNASMLLAMIYRPVEKIYRLFEEPTFKIQKYNTDSLKERANLFQNKLSADIFESVIAFFLNLQNNTLANTLASLEKLIPTLPEGEKKEELMKKIAEVQKFLNTCKNGESSHSYITSTGTIWQKLIMRLKKVFSRI